MKLCLVSEHDVVAAVVRLSCPPPHQVEVVPMEGIVDEKHSLSERGRSIVQQAASYDAILLDWDMERAPVINTLCYHVRKTLGAPLIALCRDGQEEQIAALAAGADDAISFPFGPPLLQARMAAYRRLVEAVRGVSPSGEEPQAFRAAGDRHFFELGELRLDRTAHKCFVRDEEMELTLREFSLLNYFLENAEVACTRDQILDHVWGINFDTGTNMVDVYVYFLRRKLAAHGFRGVIETVRGYGYRLTMPEEEAS